MSHFINLTDSLSALEAFQSRDVIQPIFFFMCVNIFILLSVNKNMLFLLRFLVKLVFQAMKKYDSAATPAFNQLVPFNDFFPKIRQRVKLLLVFVRPMCTQHIPYHSTNNRCMELREKVE